MTLPPRCAFDQLLDLIELRGGFDSDRLPGREPAELAAMIERAAALPLPFGVGWVRDAMYHWDVDYFNLVFGMRPRLEHPPGHGHPPVDGAFGALHSTLATQEAAPGSRRRQGVESTRSV